MLISLGAPNTAGPTWGSFLCFAARHWLLTVNRRSCLCCCFTWPAAQFSWFFFFLIKPKLLKSKVSVKPPQNLQSSDRTRAGAGLGLVWGFVEMFVLLRRHRWTWRWFYCGIIVIWGCAFSPQRVWHECKNQGFLRLGYFIFCLILISALARPAMEGSPSWEKPQPPFCHCYFWCLFLLAKRLKPTAGGAEEQRWELQAGKTSWVQSMTKTLCWAWGNLSQLQLRVKLFRQKSISGHYLLLWIVFSPPALEKWLNAWDNWHF